MAQLIIPDGYIKVTNVTFRFRKAPFTHPYGATKNPPALPGSAAGCEMDRARRRLREARPTWAMDYFFLAAGLAAGLTALAATVAFLVATALVTAAVF